MNVEQTAQIDNRPADNIVDISWQELYRRLGDKSLIIVDVLPREAYMSGHIPGALSLPLAEVDSRAREVIPDRDAEIAVYCASAT
jgi:rhodanese-related sulfurtransferase